LIIINISLLCVLNTKDGTFLFKENASSVDICILFFFISGKEDNRRDCGNTSTIHKKASENHNSKEFNTSEFVSL